MKLYSYLILVVAFAVPTFAKTFDRCSLAQELSRFDVPRSELARWTCIAEHESTYRTNVVGKANTNGSNDYGIFQINNYYWCQPANGRFSYDQCQMSCDQLLTENIANSIRCAQKILRMQGWTAWSTWRFCKGTLPSIDDCF